MRTGVLTVRGRRGGAAEGSTCRFRGAAWVPSASSQLQMDLQENAAQQLGHGSQQRLALAWAPFTACSLSRSANTRAC